MNIVNPMPMGILLQYYSEMTNMNPSFKQTNSGFLILLTLTVEIGSQQKTPQYHPGPSSVNLTPGHLFGLQATQTPKIYERIGHSFRLQAKKHTLLKKLAAKSWQQSWSFIGLPRHVHFQITRRKKNALCKKHVVASDVLPLLTSKNFQAMFCC